MAEPHATRQTELPALAGAVLLAERARKTTAPLGGDGDEYGPLASVVQSTSGQHSTRAPRARRKTMLAPGGYGGSKPRVEGLQEPLQGLTTRPAARTPWAHGAPGQNASSPPAGAANRPVSDPCVRLQRVLCSLAAGGFRPLPHQRSCCLCGSGPSSCHCITAPQEARHGERCPRRAWGRALKGARRDAFRVSPTARTTS